MERLLELGGVRAESRFVEVAGARLHYLESGSGPAVVLLQGAGGGAANWFLVMERLAERFRVLALDVPGFGLSEPIVPEAPLGAHMAGVVQGWLRAVGVERCDVVGTSFGGLVAARLAQRAPEMVRRLVLLDAAGLGRELPFLVRLAGTTLLGGWLLRPGRFGTAWTFRHLLTSDRREMSATVQAALVDYLWCSAVAGDPVTLARAFRLFCDLSGQREVLGDAELRALGLPVLVAWGERDDFLPAAHGRRAAARMPAAALHLIPAVGHSPNWEAPESLCDILLPFLAT